MTKEEKKNPHDQFFKETFAQVETAIDFLQNYLPAEIVQNFDLTTLERLEDSFVDEELSEHLSDLLFRVELKNRQEAFVFILFEHKSSPDKWVALQILRYLVQIWEKSRRDGAKKLPLVLPIVFYHGKRTWNFPTEFAALFDFPNLPGMRDFLPEFRYHICDLNLFADEDLRGNPALLSAVLLLKHIFQNDLKDKLIDSFAPLTELADDDKMIRRFGVMTHYLLGANKAEEKEIIAAWKKATQGEEKMETFIERWQRLGLEKGMQQGMQQGIQQGMQQGMQQGKLEAISDLTFRLLNRRFSKIDDKLVNQIKKLPLLKLEKLSEDLIDFASIEDLENWLKSIKKKNA